MFYSNSINAKLKCQKIGNHYLDNLVNNLENGLLTNLPLESIRDKVRQELHAAENTLFPYGPTEASVDLVAEWITYPSKPNDLDVMVCHTCGTEASFHPNQRISVIEAYTGNPISTQDAIENFHTPSTERSCHRCQVQLERFREFMTPPDIILLDISKWPLVICPVVKVPFADDQRVSLPLRGIVYHGSNHFTSRIIAKDGTIFEHDGTQANGMLVENGNLKLIDLDLLEKLKSSTANLAVYSTI